MGALTGLVEQHSRGKERGRSPGGRGFGGADVAVEPGAVAGGAEHGGRGVGRGLPRQRRGAEQALEQHSAAGGGANERLRARTAPPVRPRPRAPPHLQRLLNKRAERDHVTLGQCEVITGRSDVTIGQCDITVTDSKNSFFLRNL